MAESALNSSDLERLREGLRNVDNAIRMAEQAKQAGLPVDAQLEKAQKTRDQLLRIKNTFFPGQ